MIINLKDFVIDKFKQEDYTDGQLININGVDFIVNIAYKVVKNDNYYQRSNNLDSKFIAIKFCPKNKIYMSSSFNNIDYVFNSVTYESINGKYFDVNFKFKAVLHSNKHKHSNKIKLSIRDISNPDAIFFMNDSLINLKKEVDRYIALR